MVYQENALGIKWNNGIMENWKEKNGKEGIEGKNINIGFNQLRKSLQKFQLMYHYSIIPLFQYSRITMHYPREPLKLPEKGPYKSLSFNYQLKNRL